MLTAPYADACNLLIHGSDEFHQQHQQSAICADFCRDCFHFNRSAFMSALAFTF